LWLSLPEITADTTCICVVLKLATNVHQAMNSTET
jgi:hypothetical protein